MCDWWKTNHHVHGCYLVVKHKVCSNSLLHQVAPPVTIQYSVDRLENTSCRSYHCLSLTFLFPWFLLFQTVFFLFIPTLLCDVTFTHFPQALKRDLICAYVELVLTQWQCQLEGIVHQILLSTFEVLNFVLTLHKSFGCTEPFVHALYTLQTVWDIRKGVWRVVSLCRVSGFWSCSYHAHMRSCPEPMTTHTVPCKVLTWFRFLTVISAALTLR